MTAPEFDMNDPEQQPEEKFLDTIVGVFANPVPTLIGVVRRRPIANAFIVIIVVSIAQGLMQALSRDPDTLGDAQELAAVIQAFTILISPVFGIGFTALITGLYWIMSRMLGGNGEYGAMFAGVGFASAPSILSALIGFLAIPLGSSGEASGEAFLGLVQLGVTIWTIILSVIVVRESNQVKTAFTGSFSTGRASAAVLISIAALIIIVSVLAAVVVVLFVLAAAVASL